MTRQVTPLLSVLTSSSAIVAVTKMVLNRVEPIVLVRSDALAPGGGGGLQSMADKVRPALMGPVGAPSTSARRKPSDAEVDGAAADHRDPRLIWVKARTQPAAIIIE